MVAWSYGLLTGSEQTLLARLSVFAGSFPRTWAVDVCGYQPLDPDDITGCRIPDRPVSPDASGSSDMAEYELLRVRARVRRDPARP